VVSKTVMIVNDVIALVDSWMRWKLNTPKIVANRSPGGITCKILVPHR